MSKALAINPDIGLREVLEVSQDNNYDIVYNPLLQGPGGSVGGTFIKPSATHAGASTTYDNPDALPGDASVRQLKEFAQSRNQSVGKGNEGMALIKTNGGEYKPVPYDAALSAEYAGNAEIVMGGEDTSLNRALQAYVQHSGNSLMTPTVY